MNHFSTQRITVDVQPEIAGSSADLSELRHGLLSDPKHLPSKYFYDRTGSALFEKITKLPEYYLTGAERSLLVEVADDIAVGTRAKELIELGAGAATKTRILLDALERHGTLQSYVPFDFSESEVLRVAQELAAEYPSLKVHGMVADFVHHLEAIPAGGRRLIALLGSTIGNFSEQEASQLIGRIAARMTPDDHFLLGVDLIKDVAVIESAYNDSLGVTADFNRNILAVVNRIAGGDFNSRQFDHLATYHSELNRIEMYLVSQRPQIVRLDALSLTIEVEAKEAIRTEISCKYDQAAVERLLAQSGMTQKRWYSDPAHRFGLALAHTS